MYDDNCVSQVNMMFYTEVEDAQQYFDQCGCLPDCNSIQYEQSVIFSKHEPTVEVIDNVTTTVEQGSLRFFFGSDEYTALKRYGSYDAVSFLSTCGGLLGLFLGVSVLSVVEVFYFFFMRMFSNLVKRIRRNTKVEEISINRKEASIV